MVGKVGMSFNNLLNFSKFATNSYSAVNVSLFSYRLILVFRFYMDVIILVNIVINDTKRKDRK